MRGASLAGLVIVAILVGAGVGYLYGGANVRMVTSVSTTSRLLTSTSLTTTTTVFTTTSYETTTLSTATVPSLEIIAGVSPAVITSGQNVTVNWGIYNPLLSSVEVRVPSYTNPYTAGCPLSEDPTTFYIYSGHVTFSTLSGNSPLLLYNQSIPLPCFVGFNSTLMFEPHSYHATVYALGSTLMASMNYTTNFSGYWVQGPGSGYSFRTFPPGQYSVLFNDIWGQQDLEYFAVNP